MKQYSIVPYWDKTAMDKKTKVSRVMLTVNNVGKQFRITLPLRATKVDFLKATNASRTLSEEAKNVRKEWNDYLAKAESILKRLDKPTKETFTRLFKSETDLSKDTTEISLSFKHKISKLFLEEKFSSSRTYQQALTSFSKYKSPIHFEDIDKEFLKGYVSYCLSKGNSIATANMYLRNLRVIFNELIADGIISARHYPFKGFKISSSVRSKSVLYPAQLKMLLEHKSECMKETKAKAFFFFCYLSNGMNFQDAGLLQYKNIAGDMLTFVRHKTRNSSAKEIKVYLHDLTKEIINQYGNKSKCPDDYVLGLVNNKMSAWDIQNTLNKHKKLSNISLSKIGKELGFGVHLCLNLARHSFATKMKINNVSVAAISDAMGHTTTNTTEHYMKSLPNENLKVMSSNLLSF